MSTSSTPPPRPDIFLPGNRTGVLLLHGFSGTLEDLRPGAEYLHQAGFTVFAPWLAGHGTSAEDLQTKSGSDWVLSLRRGLLKLRETCDQIVIVGDSFGGNLALYGSLIGEPVKGVVTLGTPVMLRHDLLKRAVVPLLRRLKPYSKKKWVKDAAAHHARGSYTVVPLRAFQEMITFIDRHTKRELEGVTVPLRIYQATKDWETHPHSAYFLFEHAGSTDKEIIWIKEKVHHVLSSSQRHAILQGVTEFIRRVAPPV